jgi:two-component system sensor histidine kinase/response regulator
MTHEIRTPMNVVIGMAEQMGMTPLEPQQREFLSYISSSANSLLSIIQDILDFSKMEAGKLSIPSIDCNLHQTILQAVSPLATLAEQQGIELLLLLDDQLPEWVCSAPERIRQILTNLIANAIKFTLEGEVVLTVSVLKKTAHQTEVEFTIRDTGNQGVYKGIQVTLQNRFQVVKGQLDTVVAHAGLRKVIGPYSFIALTGADLCLPLGRVLRILFGNLPLQEA